MKPQLPRHLISFVAVLGFAGACSVKNADDYTFDDDALAHINGASTTGGASSGLGGAAAGGSGGSTPGSGGADAGFCEPGGMRCSGPVVQLCLEEEWTAVGSPCPFACVDAMCTGSCVPDATECTSNSTLRRCDERGVWEEEDICRFACVDGACSGECRPGDRDCNGDPDGKHPRVRVCSDAGKWIAEENDCADTCTSGVCVGCTTSGSTQCVSPTEFQTCDGSSWGPNETCSNQACVGNACSGECAPGAKRCSSSFEFQVCSNQGKFEAAISCGGQACDEKTGNCVGECRPGTSRCSGNGDQRCDSTGHWEAVEGCGKGEVCFDGSCQGGDFCEKTDVAQGCVSTSERWYCSKGKLRTAACALLTSCRNNSGSCTGILATDRGE